MQPYRGRHAMPSIPPPLRPVPPVYSAHAERVEVHIFAHAVGADEVASYQLMQNNATGIWQTTVPMSDLAPECP